MRLVAWLAGERNSQRSWSAPEDSERVRLVPQGMAGEVAHLQLVFSSLPRDLLTGGGRTEESSAFLSGLSV